MNPTPVDQEGAPPRPAAAIIDIHNHVMPAAHLDLVRAHYKDERMVKRRTSIRLLWDMEARVAMLDRWPGLQQGLRPIDSLGLDGDTRDKLLRRNADRLLTRSAEWSA